MSDRESMHPGATSPARSAVAITPDDETTVEPRYRAVYVGGFGNLAVEMEDGSAVTFVAVSAGSILPIRVGKVLATGTTATALIGLR